MIKREHLNELVVFTLKSSRIDLQARELYEIIRIQNPDILRRDKVFNFRGFVQILGDFPQLSHVGKPVQKYSVIKGF